MTELNIALVGAYHRPPAKQILGQLPVGTELILQPDPQNNYDSKAIKVLVDLTEAISIWHFDQVDKALEGTGFTMDELIRGSYNAQTGGYDLFQLGFLADSDGKATRGKTGNREAKELMDIGPVIARLGFEADGKAIVKVEPRPENESINDDGSYEDYLGEHSWTE